ncbi:MAG: murein biosynthesis integral membrane protein MurJ [Gemmatimonadetes bacterium]|uniref:Probable lipid II flippase MurJ n=1 Tax=Candidatus Kutchimonas denitrificans TaxID=3056748 RepID=A0AAE5C9A0_9BACT|nr:murein biosynthesis integral membrane protein MurJ [Gemmatimonadota bacterium]NIR75271.1 murein biosynthesis integral membrane protein MurJ [Candidatus Kutchimonas denitrificans]NIS00209.1 murein biosynthesis integral membrane protein MurJ [Gemmatimonadota bacterium]NIT65801.1 murein biosynthesis integral membrane protein MurJ [Gemmatimonadota bacterium]NIU53079.1 murein biosynthesis integral membrane protein MurJ [Gemmatimonadota bacterium]
MTRRPRSALAVGAGIFLSRLAGFGRDVAIAAFFGTGLAADAYTAALRIPNTIRNLLGEGTLSASFIPVYSGLLARESETEARRLAGTVLSLLAVLAAVLSGLGVLLAPWITEILVPRWSPEKLELTTRLVRILFPMAGMLILAAWCLGVLNSHRRFFLSFAAPAIWNLAQILGLLLAWRAGWDPLVVALAWATLIGAVLQFLVQVLPSLRLTGRLRLSLDTAWRPVRTVVRNFGPVVLGAGVAQVSGLLDVFLAGLLANGALATLAYAQRLYYLPLALFGTSVAASSLPELSREAELDAREALRVRLRDGFRGIAFYIVPSAIAFILFGDWIVSFLFQRGSFVIVDTVWVHATLGAYAVGLLAASSVKLFASGFHAMLDTRTPVKFAAAGLAVGAALGAILMWRFYVPGLAFGAALGSWLYLLLLWTGLRRRIGVIFHGGDVVYLLKLLAACAAGAAAGFAAEFAVAPPEGIDTDLLRRLAVTLATLGAFGVVYLGACRLARVTAAAGPRPGERSTP